MHQIADIACNFTSERFNKDLNEVINRAMTNKISKFGLICSRLGDLDKFCLLYTSPSPRDRTRSRMPSSA